MKTYKRSAGKFVSTAIPLPPPSDEPVRIRKPSLDDEVVEGNPCLRGVILPESIPHLQIDPHYQREFLSANATKTLAQLTPNKDKPMTKYTGPTDPDLEESLVWCKQSLMRIMAWLSFQHEGAIDALCDMLNSIETREEEDKEAIPHFIAAIKSYSYKD